MHTHCEASPDSRTPIAEQARGVRAAGIDVICATDHNTIDGGLRLRELADGFRVVIGEAIFLNNRSAAAYAKEHDIVGTAGSDAHRAAEIGRAFVEMPDFAGRGDFLDALRQGEVHGHLSGTRVHFFTRYDRLRKWLGRRSSSPSR